VGIEMCYTYDEIFVSLLLVSILCYCNYRRDGCFAEFAQVQCVLMCQNTWLLMYWEMKTSNLAITSIWRSAREK